MDPKGSTLDSVLFGKGFDVYNKDNLFAVIISFIFFILFYIAQTLEFNNILQDFGLSDTVISKAKMIYVYLSGYFIFIVKFFIAFLVFVLLMAVITLILVAFINVIINDTSSSFLKNATAEQIYVNSKRAFFTKLSEGLRSTGKYLLLFVALKQFFMIYLVVIPIFLFIFYLLFALTIYKPSSIEEDTNKERIMSTNHAYFFYLFISISIVALIYLFVTYAKGYGKF